MQAKLTAPVAGTVSGANITFSGTLENANPYPVVDGALYVKVFKSRGTTNDGNGPDVVDQFFVQENIAIPANGSVPVSFAWRVPSYAQSGDYRSRPSSPPRTSSISLVSRSPTMSSATPCRSQCSASRTAGVAFDKASVTVNDRAVPLRRVSAARWRRAGRVRHRERRQYRNHSERAQISVEGLPVGRAARGEPRAGVESASVTVPAGGSAPVSITITDAKYPVYLVVGTLSWKDTKSIIGVRFVREGVDRTRINFPSIMSFPLQGRRGEHALLLPAQCCRGRCAERTPRTHALRPATAGRSPSTSTTAP